MSEARAQAQTTVVDADLLPLATGMLFFVPIAFVGNELGVLLRYPQIGAAVLYPPYAALTAALVASHRRHWIWYILAASIVHAAANLAHWPVSWVLLADLANIARAVVAAVALRAFFGGPPKLDSIPELVLFCLAAVVVAPAVGATIGAANLVIHNASPSYWRPWTGWFMASALTALTMLPMFLSAVRTGSNWRSMAVDRRRLAEGLALAAALAVTCTIAFLLRITSRWDLALLIYGPLPLLFWAALRFGPGGASVAVTLVAFAAILGADRGTGPFLSLSPDDTVLALQLVLLLTALPVLCIAAVGGARHGAVQLYHALLASLQDHVAIVDARGMVLEVNESWRRFADAGHPCPFDRVRAGDDYLVACREAVSILKKAGKAEADITAARALGGIQSVLSGEQRRFEMEYEQTGDMRPEWYTMRVEALERPDGGAVVTRANVSARRRAQLEIEEQRRELSHLARVGVLGQLSGALAHELSQPLSSILSNAEAARHLLKRERVDKVELGAILQDIVTEDRRASQVISGLRAMLKRGETRVQPVETVELVRETLELAHAELITRGVGATSYVEPELPPVLADRVQVQQVLLNLILNACEAMSEAPSDDRRLHFSATKTETGDVRFSIRDGGNGFPPELIERLFEPFVTTKAEGLGLGLSIARAIVAAHGGRIWAENNLGRGATVHCVLSATSAGAVAEMRRRDEAAPTADPSWSAVGAVGAVAADAAFSPSGARRRNSPLPRT
ncbi:MAG TPA: ATP-binding protein [Gemmatimonadaceae bacterium]